MGAGGDPILWQMMLEHLAKHPMPKDQKAMRQIFSASSCELTDHVLDDAPDHLSVPTTDRPNGGMSRGMISGVFWREKALPLVLSRLDAAQG